MMFLALISYAVGLPDATQHCCLLFKKERLTNSMYPLDLITALYRRKKMAFSVASWNSDSILQWKKVLRLESGKLRLLKNTTANFFQWNEDFFLAF